MLLEKCPRCKKRIKKEVDIEKYKMFYCPKCQVMVSCPSISKEVKGGNEMVAKKTTTKPKAKKTEKVEEPKTVSQALEVEEPTEKPKAGVGKVREENAKKLDDFLTGLGADDVEKRKICSRLYGMIVIRQKQN